MLNGITPKIFQCMSQLVQSKGEKKLYKVHIVQCNTINTQTGSMFCDFYQQSSNRSSQRLAKGKLRPSEKDQSADYDLLPKQNDSRPMCCGHFWTLDVFWCQSPQKIISSCHHCHYNHCHHQLAAALSYLPKVISWWISCLK